MGALLRHIVEGRGGLCDTGKSSCMCGVATISLCSAVLNGFSGGFRGGGGKAGFGLAFFETRVSPQKPQFGSAAPRCPMCSFFPPARGWHSPCARRGGGTTDVMRRTSPRFDRCVPWSSCPAPAALALPCDSCRVAVAVLGHGTSTEPPLFFPLMRCAGTAVCPPPTCVPWIGLTLWARLPGVHPTAPNGTAEAGPWPSCSDACGRLPRHQPHASALDPSSSGARADPPPPTHTLPASAASPCASPHNCLWWRPRGLARRLVLHLRCLCRGQQPPGGGGGAAMRSDWGSRRWCDTRAAPLSACGVRSVCIGELCAPPSPRSAL